MWNWNDVANLMLFGLAGCWLFVLIVIYTRGCVRLLEPRRWILVVEMILMVCIIALAIYNLCKSGWVIG